MVLLEGLTQILTTKSTTSTTMSGTPYSTTFSLHLGPSPSSLLLSSSSGWWPNHHQLWLLPQMTIYGFMFKYVLLGGVILLFVVRLLRKRARMVKLIEQIPGPPVDPWFPWLGHALLVLDLDRFKFQHGTYALIYQMIASVNQIYRNEGICKMWVGLKPLVLLYSPDDVEVTLS